jgi:hypothetical protein
MDIVTSFVPNREAAIAMEPGVRAFDDPATDAQAAAMRRPPTGQDRDDALRVEAIAMGLGVACAPTIERCPRVRRVQNPPPDIGAVRLGRATLRSGRQRTPSRIRIAAGLHVASP